MLSDTELATIRAALRFWKDEIVPSGIETAKPYFDQDAMELLDAEEINLLITSFESSAVETIQWNELGDVISRSMKQKAGKASLIIGSNSTGR